MKYSDGGNEFNLYSFCAICNLVDGKPQWQDEVGPDGQYDLIVYTLRDDTTKFLGLRIQTSGSIEVEYDVPFEDDQDFKLEVIKSLGILSLLLDGVSVLSKQQVNFRASAILTHHFDDEWRLNVIEND